MADHESTMKWKVDIGDLTKAMQEARRSINEANAEFKTATAGMDRWSQSTDGLEAKIAQLNKTLPYQKTILADLERQYEITAKNMGENSKQAVDLKIKIEEQRATIVKTETNISKYNDQLTQMHKKQAESETATGKLNKTIEEQQQKLNELKRAYSDAVLQYGKNSDEARSLAKEITSLSSELAKNKTQMQETDKAADDLDRSLDNVDESARNAANGGFTVLKGALANLVSQTINKAVDGLKSLAKETLNAGMNFESGMSKVSAISGATGDDLTKLSNKAKEMGEKTKFSASESADAFTYMAMAGWKTEDMLNGIEGIMNLAAASGSDLATTSDIVTDALTAMGYSAGDAGRLADVMAAASSSANTNVDLMGNTFKYVAPIVGALGYSMEDTALAIALMANAGIKGEQAGTALRSVLTRLSAPPKECADAMDELGISLTDSEGNMKSLDQVMQELRVAFSGLDETSQTAYAKQIAGQEAMSGLLAIVRSSPEDFDKMSNAINNSTGAAERMANTMNDNVSGQITILKSKIEGIMIKVFENMSDSIRKALDIVSKALDNVDWNRFASAAGEAAKMVADFFAFVLDNGAVIVDVLKSIATAFVTYQAVSTITTVVGAFGSLFTAIQSGTGIVALFNTTLAANPIGIVAASVVGLTTLLTSLWKTQQENIQAQYGLNEEQQKAIDKASALADSYATLSDARNRQVDSINAEFGYINELKNEYNSLIDANGNVKAGYEDRANFILNQLAESMGVEVSAIQELIDQNGQLGDSIDRIIEKKQAEAVLSANEQLYTDAIAKRGEALNTLTEAQAAVDEAEKKYQETSAASQEVMQTYQDLLVSSPMAAQGYLLANQSIIDSNDTAKASYEDAKQQVQNAEDAWIGYNSVIQNYEGLAAAIISGDADKINSAMANMTNNFITAETGNRESLERQVQNYQANLDNLEAAIRNGTPNVTQEMVNQAQSMVDAANAELDKLPPEASKTGDEAGDNYAKGVGSHKGDAQKAGSDLREGADSGAKDKGEGKANGDKFGSDYVDGVESKSGNAKKAGQDLASEAESGSKEHDSYNSGSNFGEGFHNGIGSWIDRVWGKAKELAQKAWDGLKKGQEEGSPSKLTTRSGMFFGEGYENGIVRMIKPVTQAASNMAKQAVDALGANLNEEMRAIGVDGGNSLIEGMNGVLPDMSDSINGLKQSVAASSEAINSTNVGTFASSGGNGDKVQNVTFNQYNTSPKALSRLELYRETNSLLFSAKVGLQNV